MSTTFPLIDGVRYSEWKQVGAGGNGSVWKAKSSADGCWYAVKQIPKNRDERKNERFRAEIQYGLKTSHPNVVKIHGAAENSSYFYYVMDLYSGNLREVFRDERDPDMLLSYLSQLCAATAHVHSSGAVHRDIKPENVLIDKSTQTLVLADFGIAHFKDSTLTVRRDRLANRTYLAPEQMNGQDAREVDASADVFAVGLIINEAFTRQYARGHDLRRVRDVQPHLAEIDDLVELMILQDPSERISSKAAADWLEVIRRRTSLSLNEVVAHLRAASPPPPGMADAERVLRSAARDILAGQHIFERSTDLEVGKYNLNYHCEYGYSVSQDLMNLCVHFAVYNNCRNKFDLEAPHELSATAALEPTATCTEIQVEAMLDILRAHALAPGSRWEYLARQAIHYFRFCRDYHCDELLKHLAFLASGGYGKDDWQLHNGVSGAPIVSVVQQLRGFLTINDAALPPDERRALSLSHHLRLDWSTTDLDDQQRVRLGAQLFAEAPELIPVSSVLDRFASEWGASFVVAGPQAYAIFFNSRDNYERFEAFALGIASADSLLAADVKGLFQWPEILGDHIELRWDKTFDIPNTLAKVLGMRAH